MVDKSSGRRLVLSLRARDVVVVKQVSRVSNILVGSVISCCAQPLSVLDHFTHKFFKLILDSSSLGLQVMISDLGLASFVVVDALNLVHRSLGATDHRWRVRSLEVFDLNLQILLAFGIE